MKELKPIAKAHGLNLNRLRDYNKAIKIKKYIDTSYMNLLKELNI